MNWQTALSMPDNVHSAPSAKPQGMVVLYPCKPRSNPRSHERIGQLALANKLAALKGYDFAGEFDQHRAYEAPLYFVPNDTLPGFELARQIGIKGEHDLFGGVVPHAFVATKVITHSLIDTSAAAPSGWSAEVGLRMQEVTLPGFSVFSPEDARHAAKRLLAEGAVRMKKASGIGGVGQFVIRDSASLEAALQGIAAEEWSEHGVVLERNLNRVQTHSIGTVKVGNLIATYCGMQHTTTNNHGEEVYGGSTLTVVRGDFDALLALNLPQETRTAISQARAYHAAAIASYPGMFASRCNYDVAQGMDDAGQWRSGVLEQSWRIGGASGAEIAALESFVADPRLDVICASTTEIYHPNPTLPQDAAVYCQQIDERVGPITKYTQIKPYANP